MAYSERTNGLCKYHRPLLLCLHLKARRDRVWQGETLTPFRTNEENLKYGFLCGDFTVNKLTRWYIDDRWFLFDDFDGSWLIISLF